MVDFAKLTGLNKEAWSAALHAGRAMETLRAKEPALTTGHHPTSGPATTDHTTATETSLIKTLYSLKDPTERVQAVKQFAIEQVLGADADSDKFMSTYVAKVDQLLSRDDVRSAIGDAHLTQLLSREPLQGQKIAANMRGLIVAPPAVIASGKAWAATQGDAQGKPMAWNNAAATAYFKTLKAQDIRNVKGATYNDADMKSMPLEVQEHMTLDDAVLFHPLFHPATTELPGTTRAEIFGAVYKDLREGETVNLSDGIYHGVQFEGIKAGTILVGIDKQGQDVHTVVEGFNIDGVHAKIELGARTIIDRMSTSAETKILDFNAHAGATVKYAIFNEERISMASHLDGTYWEHVNFQGTSLHGVSMEGASFTKTNFTGCDVSGLSVANGKFTDVTISGASLNGLNLRGASVKGLTLAADDLKGVNLSQITGSELNLTGKDFSKLDLRDTKVSKLTINGEAITDPLVLEQKFGILSNGGTQLQMATHHAAVAAQAEIAPLPHGKTTLDVLVDSVAAIGEGATAAIASAKISAPKQAKANIEVPKMGPDANSNLAALTEAIYLSDPKKSLTDAMQVAAAKVSQIPNLPKFTTVDVSLGEAHHARAAETPKAALADAKKESVAFDPNFYKKLSEKHNA